jgi:group I intron endonuclease
LHVYVITNTVNGKIYVGQHSGDDLQKYLNHRCNMALRNDRCSLLFNRAVRKYGKSAFTIRSLINPIDKQQMDEMEKFFIRTLETQNPEIGYNVTAGGGGMLGYKPTESHRQNVSDSLLQVGRKRNNTSGTTGVTWKSKGNLWVAKIQVRGIEMLLGQFISKEDAVEARGVAEHKLRTLGAEAFLEFWNAGARERRSESRKKSINTRIHQGYVPSIPTWVASLGGRVSKHKRYHVNRGISNPDCKLCVEQGTQWQPIQ